MNIRSWSDFKLATIAAATTMVVLTALLLLSGAL